MRQEGCLISGGLVADPATGSATRLDLLIERGLISAIGPSGTLTRPGLTVHDATQRLVTPGLVNAHTHSHANLAKGAADRWTLEASLTHAPWLAGERDPETIYTSTLLGAADMLSKGCTACFDLVFQLPCPSVEGFDAVARAYADAGMRAVLAPMVADKTLFTAIPGLLEALPAELRDEIRNISAPDRDAILSAVREVAAMKGNLPDGIGLAVAPTIPHHCSERFLLDCAGIAGTFGLPIHMHIAESRLQALTARKLYGMGPAAYLAQLGVLRPGFVAAHAVWLDSHELDLLARHGCHVAHIPASNFRLGSGIAHIRPMLDRGIACALATDGANSSDALSMLQAMRLASYAARAFAEERDRWLTARETVHLATEGGADVLGLRNGGRIKEGALADLTFYDLTAIDFLPLTDPLNQLVTCADSASVRDVMVNGRFVVRNGALTTIDLGGLRERVRAAAGRLSRQTAPARLLSERLQPHVVRFAQEANRQPLPFHRQIEAGE